MTSVIHTADIEVVDRKRGLHVRVRNDITVRNSAEVAGGVISAWEAEKRPGQLLLDLQDVQEIDSSGIGALMEIRQKLVDAKSRLVLCALREGPRRTLERMGLFRLFEIRDRAEDAEVVLPPGRRRQMLSNADPSSGRRSHRALWAAVWFCVIAGALAGVGVSAYPTLQRYHAQLEQVPVLNGMMSAMDRRAAAIEQGIQSFKGRLTALEGGFQAHQRTESRLHNDLKSRLRTVEQAQQSTDARVAALEQQVDRLKADRTIPEPRQ